MKKLMLIFNFILRGAFWGVLVCAILGAVGAVISQKDIVSGIVSDAVAGILVGMFNGVVLGTITARYFYPLQTPRNYHVKITLYACILTLVFVPLALVLIARQPNTDEPFLWLFRRLFIMLFAAPVIGYYLASWYLKTQATFD